MKKAFGIVCLLLAAFYLIMVVVGMAGPTSLFPVVIFGGLGGWLVFKGKK